MKITPDTNLLVRALADDEPRQAQIARSVLRDAEAVVVTTSAICEVVWVLRSWFKFTAPDIATGLRLFLTGTNVLFDEAVVAAGLAHLDAGGDFADGAIAADGALRGSEQFVSFDRQAVRIVLANGGAARLLR